jgi:hypothetical protein
VSPQKPGRKATAADAVEIVGREDGERGNGGKDIAGQFGAGEGEEDHGKERPKDEEFGEGVPARVWPR